jgi:outer membrane receptor protein involved in Fe transport
MPAYGQEAPATAEDALMGEIVVTARKRSESVQDVPIAISAFSAESLAARGLTRVDQLAGVAPNITIQNSPGYGGATNNAAIYIRGIGQFDFLGSVDPGVGLYINGVYIARSVGAILDLVDIERVEILRGPQGTLFGRNTIGGAVDITTRQPGTELAVNASALYGTDNRLEIKGGIDLPIAEGIYARLSAGYFTQDGYVKRLVDDLDLGNKDTFVGQALLRLEPTERLTINLSFDYTRDKSNGAPFVLRGANPASRIFNPNGRTLLPPGPGPSLSPFFLAGPQQNVGGLPFGPFSGTSGGTPVSFDGAGNPVGFEGRVDPSLAGFLPPGVSPATTFYQISTRELAPGVVAPFDVPVDNFALLNNYLATFLGGQNCISAPFTPYNGFAGVGNPACFNEQYYEGNIGRNRNAGTGPSFAESTIWGLGGTINYDFGDLELVSVTAYRKLQSEFSRDSDNTPLLIAQLTDSLDQWQFSQELQLKGQSFGGRMNWILGGYYFKEEVKNVNDVRFPPVDVRSGGDIENKSLAGFAQASFDVTDALTLTGGLRYTKDEKSFSSGNTQYILTSRTPAFLDCANAATPAGCPAQATNPPGLPPSLATGGPLTIFPDRESSLEIGEWTPYLNASYKVTGDLLIYASFSQGFKSGGFTQRVFPPVAAAPSVGPEKVTVYEGGFKFQSADRRLRLNGAAFYSDYNDLQLQGFTPETGVAPVYVNAGSAVLKGFELELALAPGDDWFFESAVGFIDDQLSDIPPIILGVDDSKRLERVSRWTISAGLQKDFNIQGAVIRPRVDWSYRSKFFNDASNLEAIAQPGFSLFNASLTYVSPGGRFSAMLEAQNLFNKRYILTSIFNANLQLYEVVPARDRQFAFSVKTNF